MTKEALTAKAQRGNIMNKQIEALKLALETLECWQRNEDCNEPMSKILEAIKEALAQPEQEPVAWMNDMGTHIDLNVSGRGIPLYTTPPQRTWVGLSDEERQEIALEVPIDAVLITEATLKDKNTQKTTGENNLSSD